MTKHVAALALAALIAGPLVGCMGDSEAKGRVKELVRRLAEYQQEKEKLEEERKTLEEENRRLQAQLSAATKGNSLAFEEQQRNLDNRAAGLEQKERSIVERERALLEREKDLVQREKEFHEATNMSMADLGEARRIKQEYDRMVEERNAAERSAENWLKVAWASWAGFLLVTVGLGVVAMRYYYRDRAHQREADYHREKARLARALVASEARDDKAHAVLQMLDGLAGEFPSSPSSHSPPRQLPTDPPSPEDEDNP